MIANVNDEKVRETIAKYRELQDICAEAAGMTQSKEVQIMMIEEKLAQLDWNESMAESRAEGEDNGLRIARDIQLLRREGKSDPDIVIFLMEKYKKTESQAKEIVRRMSE